uniref:Uncharacterized protein n=1 Tax=Cannabis sativa TaxID=3483 RepID=A0A803PU08_CANSA
MEQRGGFANKVEHLLYSNKVTNPHVDFSVLGSMTLEMVKEFKKDHEEQRASREAKRHHGDGLPITTLKAVRKSTAKKVAITVEYAPNLGFMPRIASLLVSPLASVSSYTEPFNECSYLSQHFWGIVKLLPMASFVWPLVFFYVFSQVSAISTLQSRPQVFAFFLVMADILVEPAVLFWISLGPFFPQGKRLLKGTRCSFTKNICSLKWVRSV